MVQGKRERALRELHRALVGPPKDPREKRSQLIADQHASRSLLSPDELLGDQAAGVYQLIRLLGRTTDQVIEAFLLSADLLVPVPRKLQVQVLGSMSERRRPQRELAQQFNGVREPELTSLLWLAFLWPTALW
jgi:hypothetical protein